MNRIIWMVGLIAIAITASAIIVNSGGSRIQAVPAATAATAE